MSLDIKNSILSGYINRGELDDLIAATSVELISKGTKNFKNPVQRIAGMGHHPFADAMMAFVRAGMIER